MDIFGKCLFLDEKYLTEKCLLVAVVYMSLDWIADHWVMV